MAVAGPAERVRALSEARELLLLAPNALGVLSNESRARALRSAAAPPPPERDTPPPVRAAAARQMAETSFVRVCSSSGVSIRTLVPVKQVNCVPGLSE